MRFHVPPPLPSTRSLPVQVRAPGRWALRFSLGFATVLLLAAVPGGSFGAPPTAGVSHERGLSVGIDAAPSVRSNGSSNWSSVQVTFLLEVTPYDGAYDPTVSDPGFDRCGAVSPYSLCNESNAIPFFAAHAGQITQAIAADHPGSNVSFALADFEGTNDSFDDGDSYVFHMDIANFTAATGFQAAVNHTLRTTVLSGGWYLPEGDLTDNILHSSSITALYGALGTSEFNWSRSAHHVVVLIGSTAPRATGLAENYYVSSSDYSAFCGHSCLSPTCEPAFSFGSVTSPACVGWTRSQTSNASESILGLAQNGSRCTGSLGGNCTVDAISLYNGVTDPASNQWPAGRLGGGPNGKISLSDSDTILNASCDLAAASGGSWDGPNFFSCPDGQSGNLTYVPIGSPSHPNTTNPSLLSALSNISLGAPPPPHPGFDRAGDLLIADQLNNRVIEVSPRTKQVVWSFGSGNASLCDPGPGAVIAPNDAERLAGGLTLIAGTGTATCPDNRVLVVNKADHIVWQYGTAGVAGNGTGPLNTPVFALQLPNHDILIVDQGNDRVIEVDLAGTIVRTYGPTSGPGALDSPNSAELLANGDWLIADENHNRVIEVNAAGHLVSRYSRGLNEVAFASRLPNGDTLIADSGHNRIVEINATKSVVFSYRTNRSASSNPDPNPTGVVELSGGDLLITDQFNDRVFELTLQGHIVFQYGVTNVAGAGFDRLDAPYSAVVVGDYTGVTSPPPAFR